MQYGWASVAVFYAVLAPLAEGQSAQSILSAKCVSCHGSARMSNLDMRDRVSLLKGGKRGPAVLPGNARESLLYQAIERSGELKMPPGNTGLSRAELTAIRQWIDAGAAWDEKAPSSGANWWSFRKPVRLNPPAVKDVAWSANPIDAFILARLQEKELQPAPEASKQVLARRAYFDLHGLPPTPEQVDEFVSAGGATGWT
jgi:mono/diheme cytochrome c family protein